MIKFLKKFKEKILIALACSFIGIGTLLCNTIDTFAYDLDVNDYLVGNSINDIFVDSYFVADVSSCTATKVSDYEYNIHIKSTSGSNSVFIHLPSLDYTKLNSFSGANNRLIATNLSFSNVTQVGDRFFTYGLVSSQNMYPGTNPYNFSYNLNWNQLSTYGNMFYTYNTNSGYVSLNSSRHFVLRISWGGTYSNIECDINLKLWSFDSLFDSNYFISNGSTFVPYSAVEDIISDYNSLQAEYTAYQNSHSYTNEQYNTLLTQNATLTQQVQTLQSQYDLYVNNHLYTNEQYETLLSNYNNLNQIYNDLQSSYISLQNQYNMLANGQLGYLSYMEFYINNQSIEFGNDSETELNLNELIEYNLYSNNSLNLSYFTTQQVNPNYYPLTIVSYYNELPVNLFGMYFNGVTSGIIKVGYYDSSQYNLKQISFDNTGTAVDSINTSLINYEVFKGINVDYIEYIEIQFNNADLIAGSINFNSTYNIAYSTGYTNGYNYGYNVSDNVNRELINNAREEGYNNGYNVGKQEGISIGSNENNTLYGMVIRTLWMLQYLFLNKYLTLIF